MPEINPDLIDELRGIERRALAAHKRWTAHRRTAIKSWACVGLGFTTGAGFTAILLALMGYMP
jgi:hypothetical protein